MKVVLGFSGGVDSSVSARLLQQAGHQVFGLYLDNAGEAARLDAERSAEHMGIPLRTEDVRRDLEEQVCRPFAESYLRGETPNPCILCNPRVKFRRLLAEADRVGAERIATGHYARAEGGAVFKGRPANDQSYMICRLTREQAARLLLPLGELEKKQVRAMAAEWGLDAAGKPDSMEICFIPDKNYVRWLGERAALPGPGDFLFRGQVIGRHEGIFRWTVGQRIPGLWEGRKLYVSRIDGANNRVELAPWEELFRTRLLARDFSWLIEPPGEEGLEASVRVRHTKWEEPGCRAIPEGEGRLRILCREPVRAPAPGQSAVLYGPDGRLLGGGFLTAESE